MLGLLWIVILLVTGYLLTFFFFKKQDFLERVVCGIGLSIFILIASGFLLNFFTITGFSVRLTLIITLVLTILLLIFTKRYRFIQIPKIEPKKLVLLFGCAVLVAIIIYAPHFTSKYPVHFDEYWYLNFAHKVIETGHLCTNPYDGSYRCDAKTGFTALLANIFLLSNMDPLLDLQFLPAVFGVITALVIFIFIYELTKSFWTGLLAMILYSTLKGNILVLGTALAAPFPMSMSLAFLFLYLWYKWINERSLNYILLAIIILFITFTIHASAAAWMLVIAMLYSAWHLEKRWKILLPFFLPVVGISAVLFFIWFWEGSLKSTILGNIWRIQMVTTYITYPYSHLIGIPLMIFVILGLYATIRTKHQRILALFLIVTSIYYFIASRLTYFSYFIRTPRLLYIACVAAVLVGSIGIHFFLTVLKEKVKQRQILFLVAAITLVFVFYFQFKAYNLLGFEHIVSDDITYVVNDQEYQTLQFLSERYSGKKIFASPLFSMAIPITNNTVAIHWRWPDLVEADKATKLFKSPSCEEGLAWVNLLKPDVVVSRKPFPCDFLNEVNNKTGYFIYEAKIEK